MKVSKNSRVAVLFPCRAQQSLSQRETTGFYLGFLGFFVLAHIPLKLKFLSVDCSKCFFVSFRIFAR